MSEEEISKRIELYKGYKIDAPLKLSNALTVIKRKFISLFPKSNDIEMDNRIIALIAYNYLCASVGEPILNDYFNEIRGFILNGYESKNILIEQSPYNGPYQAFHKLYRENLEAKLRVNIILFGTIFYSATFLQLEIAPNVNQIIIQDLEDRKIYIAETIEEAKKGFYVVS